jgi:hypothetical protein
VRYTKASVLAVSAALAAAAPLFANDQDLIATTVPATSCQAANPTSDGKLRLVNGSWVFLPNTSGTAHLWCPLPVNMYTVSDASQDNDIQNYRIFYRDEGPASQVTVRLGYRDTDGLTWTGPEWVSVDGPGNARDTHTNMHDVVVGLYSFLVTLTRTGLQEDPAFSGIDFIVEQDPAPFVGHGQQVVPLVLAHRHDELRLRRTASAADLTFAQQ